MHTDYNDLPLDIDDFIINELILRKPVKTIDEMLTIVNKRKYNIEEMSNESILEYIHTECTNCHSCGVLTYKGELHDEIDGLLLCDQCNDEFEVELSK